MTKRISIVLTVVLLLLPLFPVSAENIYYISDAADFMRINEDPTGQYHLTCDISLDDVYTVMFPDENNAFYGLLDGQGHKIKNLTLKTDDKRVGMFGYLCGTVRGIILENCRIVSNNPKAVIGGIAAYNFGKIESCQVTGSIQKCGIYMVGCGVCGYGSALTVNCSEDLYAGGNSGSNSSCINDFGEGWDTVSSDNNPGSSSQDDTHDNRLNATSSYSFHVSSQDASGSSDENRTNSETSAVSKSTVSSKYSTSSKNKNSSVSSKAADVKKNSSQSSIAAETSDDNDTASQKSDFVVKSKDEESDNHWINTIVLIVCSAGLVALFGFAAYHEIIEKKAAAAKEKGDGEKSDKK